MMANCAFASFLKSAALNSNVTAIGCFFDDVLPKPKFAKTSANPIRERSIGIFDLEYPSESNFLHVIFFKNNQECS